MFASGILASWQVSLALLYLFSSVKSVYKLICWSLSVEIVLGEKDIKCLGYHADMLCAGVRAIWFLWNFRIYSFYYNQSIHVDIGILCLSYFITNFIYSHVSPVLWWTAHTAVYLFNTCSMYFVHWGWNYFFCYFDFVYYQGLHCFLV